MTDAAKLEAAGIGVAVMWLLGIGLFSGFIGALIGVFKNRKALGLLLGMMFGPLGWLFLLFAQDGEREEGFTDLFLALAVAALMNICMVTGTWKLILQPMVRRAEAESLAARAEADAKLSETVRVAEQAERAAAPPPMQEPDWKWARYRNPLDGSRASALPPAAPEPVNPPFRAAVRRSTPSPAQVAAEIERKYGSQQRR